MMRPSPAPAPITEPARARETPQQLRAAYAAHLALTGRGNSAYTQAAKTFVKHFPNPQVWVTLPLEEQLSVNQSLRPFLLFLMLTRRIQPSYDYVLARKFSSIWREVTGLEIEAELHRFSTAAALQGYSQRVTSAIASQIILRLLIASGHTLDQITSDDFDELTAACQARQDRLGSSWRHYRDTMPAARQVLFHLGVLHSTSTSSQWLTTTERLGVVPPPLRTALVRYLERKTVTCVPKTVSSLTTRLAHFGRVITDLDPTLTSLAQLERTTHIEPWLIVVSRTLHSRTGELISVAEQARRIQAVAGMLTEITEWGWPNAPARRLLFRSDIPRLPRPLPRYLPPDADRKLTEQLLASDNRQAADALLLQRACGLRIGELLDLEMDCVHEVPRSGAWLKVPLGKFDTERMVPLDDDIVALIDRIIADRSPGRPLPHPRTGKPADFLFTHHGHRLGMHAVRAELSRAADRAGLGPLTPHQLRHTYATALVNAGVSLQALMALLGHVSAEMSLRYGRLFDSTVRTEYERALDLAKAHIGHLPITPTPTGPGGRTALTLTDISGSTWRESPTYKSRLAGGYCMRAPAQEACPYANICEHCPSFHTDDTYIPVLEAQRKDAIILARDAEVRGWGSEAARHHKLVQRLDTLIDQANTA